MVFLKTFLKYLFELAQLKVISVLRKLLLH